MAQQKVVNYSRILQVPSALAPEAGSATEKALERFVSKRMDVGCPPELKELAVRNGERLGMKVTFLYSYYEGKPEWQVRMDTSRGPVLAAPVIREQLCPRCMGTHVIPPIFNGGGDRCNECDGESVTLEQAWRNALDELGLTSS